MIDLSTVIPVRSSWLVDGSRVQCVYRDHELEELDAVEEPAPRTRRSARVLERGTAANMRPEHPVGEPPAARETVTLVGADGDEITLPRARRTYTCSLCGRSGCRKDRCPNAAAPPADPAS